MCDTTLKGCMLHDVISQARFCTCDEYGVCVPCRAPHRALRREVRLASRSRLRVRPDSVLLGVLFTVNLNTRRNRQAVPLKLTLNAAAPHSAHETISDRDQIPSENMRCGTAPPRTSR